MDGIVNRSKISMDRIKWKGSFNITADFSIYGIRTEKQDGPVCVPKGNTVVPSASKDEKPASLKAYLPHPKTRNSPS